MTGTVRSRATGARAHQVRAIRDDIDVRVRALLAELAPTGVGSLMPTCRTGPSSAGPLRVELFSHPGCPRVGATRALVQQCLLEAGLATTVIDRVGAYPSPALVIDGRDVVGGPAPTEGVASCRVTDPSRAHVLAAIWNHTTVTDHHRD